MSIPWNPDSENTTVTTDSVAGSREKVDVGFLDKDGSRAGAVFIHFDTQIKYGIGWCSSFKPFPVTVPSETRKTWTFTYNNTERRVVFFCNEMQVLNVVLSDGTCNSWRTNSDWRDYWERKPAQITFWSDDNASDSFCISSNTGKYNGVIDSGE